VFKYATPNKEYQINILPHQKNDCHTVTHVTQIVIRMLLLPICKWYQGFGENYSQIGKATLNT